MKRYKRLYVVLAAASGGLCRHLCPQPVQGPKGADPDQRGDHPLHLRRRGGEPLLGLRRADPVLPPGRSLELRRRRGLPGGRRADEPTSTKIRPSPSPSWIFSTAARRPTASPRAPCATPAASGAITGSTRAERIAGRGNLFFREIPLPRAYLWGPRLPFPKAAVFVEEPHAPSPRLAIGLGYDRLPKRAQRKTSKEERSEKSFIRTVLPLPCFLRFL